MSRRRAITLIVILSLILSGILFINYNMTKPTKLNKIIANKYGKPANSAFTDQNFYNCVIDSYNKENRKSVSYTTSLTNVQLEKVTKLSCIDRKIKSINGVAKLKNLTSLKAPFNYLTEINVSHNKALKELDVAFNSLTEIDVSKNTALTDLIVEVNYLTTLDVSKNTNLKKLDAKTNDLTEINLRKNTALIDLIISKNNLTTLDVSQNKALEKLRISSNNLAEINLRNNTVLTDLIIFKNNLTTLDLSRNTKLNLLYASENNLTTLDLSNKEFLWTLSINGNNNLTSLDISDTNIHSLDMANLPNLTNLNASNSSLESIDNLNKATNLKMLNLTNNRISSLNVSKLTKLEILLVSGQRNSKGEKILSSLTLPNTIKDLRIGNNNLSSLDFISKCKNLETLYAYGSNKIETLNLSSNTKLTTMDITSTSIKQLYLNNISALTSTTLTNIVKSVPNITSLSLGNNKSLTKVSIGNFDNLKSVTIHTSTEGNDNISSININNNPKLTNITLGKLSNLNSLTLNDNNLTTSNLESFGINTLTGLKTLNLTNNRISSLNVSKLTKLEILLVSGQRNSKGEKILSSLTLPNTIKDLRIGNNNLSSLDFISKCKNLETLYAYGSNKIETLNLSSNTKLTTMDITSTSIKQLYLNNISALTNTMLSNIVKSVPNMTSLFLGNNSNLKSITINGHKNLTGIAISGNGNLETISITKNPKFSRITLNDLPKLQTLILNDNNLTTSSLAASSTSKGINGLTSLEELDLSNNKITSLNVSGLRNLKTLKVSNYSEGYDAVLKNITLPKNTNKGEYLLETLSIGNNLITGKLDLTNYKNLKKLYVYSSKIKEIELPHTRTLNTLSTAGSQIEKLNLSYNPGLTTITINSKVLQELDLSNITSLNKDTLTNIVKSVPNITNLSLGNNQSLTGISLTNSESNSKLEKITIHTSSKDENDNLTWITINNYPGLKTLTLGRLKKLKGLGLSNNSLTTIWNLNKKDENGKYLPNITYINLSNNSMKSLDVSNLTSLEELYISEQRDNNNNKTFNSIKLPNSDSLKELSIFDNNLKTIDLSGLSGLKKLYYVSNPYDLGTITVPIGQSVNLADSINTDNIKVNSNITKKFISAKPKENNKFNVDKDNKVTITEQGSYEYIVEFAINSSVATGTYTVKVSDIDLDIKTDYKISDENKYIYTGLETNESTILNNITINSGYEKEIKDNKLIIKKNNSKVREYTIINIIKSPSNENNYNDYLSKDYIYTKISEFKSDYVKTNIDNQEGITKTIENTDNIYEFTIGYKGEKLKTYKILTIKNKKEDKYKINGKYVYIKGKYEENTIEVTNGIIEEEKDTLKVMYEDKEIDSIPELKIDFGELNVTGNNIVLKEEITYDDFIGKITLTNLATEIYKEEEKVTSGYIEKGMTLKVYSKDMGMEETYTITDEYINVDELEVDENGYVSKYELGTTYQDIQDNITTSGSVKFIDDSEKELSLSDIIRTGSKIIINTGTEEKEYTLVVYGDVNGDGEISIFDINEAIKYKDQDKENDCYKEAADVAKDGKIDIFDYNEIIKLKKLQ